MSLDLHRRFIDGAWRYIAAQENFIQRFSVLVTPATTEVVIENVPAGTVPLRLDVSVVTAFNGATPRLHIVTNGVIAGVVSDQIRGHVDLGVADAVDAAPLNGLVVGGGKKFDSGDYFFEDTVVSAILDDGSGGNPGSTVGLARVSLIVILP